MLERLFGILIVFKLTGLWMFSVTACGFPLAYGSLATMIVCSFYLILRLPTLLQMLRLPMIVSWLALLVTATAVGAVLVEGSPMFGVSRNLALLLLFAGVATWSILVSAATANRVAWMSVGIVLLGAGLDVGTDIINSTVSAVSGLDYSSPGRVAGFFLQPNMAATQTILVFIVWLLLGKRPLYSVVLGSMVLGFIILATGSRSGIAGGSIVAMIAIVSHCKTSVFSTLAQRTWQAIRLAVIIIMATIVVLSARILPDSQVTESNRFGVEDRILSTVQLDLVPTEHAYEWGAKVRIDAAKKYVSLIKQRPFIGHGIGASEQLQSKGLARASHNMYLQFAYDYGVLFVAVWIYLLIWMVVGRHRRRLERLVGSAVCIQFVCLLLFMAWFSNSVGQLRPTWIVAGMLIAAYYRGPVFRSRTTLRFVLRDSLTGSSALTGSAPV
jgi:O-antigen ligase